MSIIVTITVNPCIDISTFVPSLLPDKKLHCGAVKKEPGGGGINVSRVIKRLGGNTNAIYMAGGYTGEFFTKMLQAENVDQQVIKIANDTRENFVVKDTSTGMQYRFGMPGPFIKQDEWKPFLDTLSTINNMDYVVASGSLTAGVPDDFFAMVAVVAKSKGAKFILDTSGVALKAALQAGVYMIKPNLGELAYITDTKALDKKSAVAAAKAIIQKKQCEIVLVSMGPQGALLVNNETVEEQMPPAVDVKSTVGAGDSMVAGFVFALSKNWSPIQSLQFAVACGTASTMNDGSGLCKTDDVTFLFKQISGKVPDWE